MSTIIKPLLALVISILIFAGYNFLAGTELVEYVQTRFYNPSILKSYSKENKIDAEISEKYIDDLQKQFAETLIDPSVYKNYNEDPIALPYETVNVPSDGKMKITMDEQTESIIFSYPFYDSTGVYRGTALFTISVRALADKLVEEGRLKFNEDVSVTGTPAGILLGSPASSKKDILEKTAAIWNSGLPERVIIDAEDSGVKFSLISLKTNRDLFFGRLVIVDLFSIPKSMQLIFKLSAFITIFLSFYFLLNIKPNAVTLVQTRTKRLCGILFEHLYTNKTVQERAKWILQLEQRRNEIRAELKRGLKLNPRLEKTIDSIINKSWDELLSVLKSGSIQNAPAETPEVVLAAAHKGLLKLSERFALKGKTNQEHNERIKGLLARAEEKENLRKSKHSGLLACASYYKNAEQDKQDSLSDFDGYEAIAHNE